MKSASGVKVTVPSALSTAVPPVPLVTLAMLRVPLVTLAMLRLSPSTSLSLPSRSAALKVTGVSSVAARLSSLASGARAVVLEHQVLADVEGGLGAVAVLVGLGGRQRHQLVRGQGLRIVRRRSPGCPRSPPGCRRWPAGRRSPA
ncbi:hypothetical protein NGA35_17765 [Pseudomonas stutzeri]|nr:hypothetical protein [Stutzerimonas stutzeri]